MRSRGDKFLLGFLAFGVLFYMLTMLSDEDSLNNSITDSSAALVDTAIAKGLREPPKIAPEVLPGIGGEVTIVEKHLDRRCDRDRFVLSWERDDVGPGHYYLRGQYTPRGRVELLGLESRLEWECPLRRINIPLKYIVVKLRYRLVESSVESRPAPATARPENGSRRTRPWSADETEIR